MKFKDIYCGAYHCLCLMEDNSLVGFGHNFNKEIGNFEDNIIDRPVAISVKLDSKYKLKKVKTL